MFNILTTCTSDIKSCCSDYGIAKYLSIMKQAINIIHIVVPIILMALIGVSLIQMVINPDDPQRKKTRNMTNKFVAAVIVFFIPYIMDTAIQLLSYGDFSPEDFNFAACYQQADDITTQMNEVEEYDATKEIKAKKIDLDIKLNTYDSTNSKGDTLKDSDMKGTKTGKKIVKYARKFIGNPYVYGGTSLTNGIDCSGFTQKVFQHFGYSLPRVSDDQAKAGKKVKSLNDAEAGDIIYYGGHVAIYEGNGKVVHASNRNDGIKESTATYRTSLAIRRII